MIGYKGKFKNRGKFYHPVNRNIHGLYRGRNPNTLVLVRDGANKTRVKAWSNKGTNVLHIGINNEAVLLKVVRSHKDFRFYQKSYDLPISYFMPKSKSQLPKKVKNVEIQVERPGPIMGKLPKWAKIGSSKKVTSKVEVKKPSFKSVFEIKGSNYPSGNYFKRGIWTSNRASQIKVKLELKAYRKQTLSAKHYKIWEKYCDNYGWDQAEKMMKIVIKVETKNFKKIKWANDINDIDAHEMRRISILRRKMDKRESFIHGRKVHNENYKLSISEKVKIMRERQGIPANYFYKEVLKRGRDINAAEDGRSPWTAKAAYEWWNKVLRGK